MNDEQSLVKRAQQRDEVAFGMIYEQYFDRIFRYVTIRVGNEMEAEDISQQVFLQALKSIDSYKWKGVPFSSWLYRIAHNQVVDYHRKREKYATANLDALPQVADIEDDNNPAEMVDIKFDIAQLGAALRKLTPAQQEVLSLRFTSELPTAEVAKMMGKSEGAVKALQHSAIVALRKALGGGK